MNLPEVSVIIAAYNVGAYLRGCLESVLNQTFQHIQVIVVNDGSTDPLVPVIIKEYAEKDPRVVVIDKPNGGLSDARNAGLKVATGRYLAFLDGDDTYNPTFIFTMLEEAKRKGCDLVCCNYRYVWNDGREPEEQNLLSALPSELDREGAVAAFLRQEIIGNVGIKLFRREICEQFDIRFPKGQNWEDITFTFEFLTHCKKVGIINRCLHNYLQTDDSITRRKDSTGILDIMIAAEGSLELCNRVFPGKYTKEKKILFTHSFICLLVYSYKCKDKEVCHTLRGKIREYGKSTSISGLTLSSKLLILLYRMSYPFSRFVFLRIYKRNK